MKILTEDILKKSILTEQEIKLLCKRANAGEKIDLRRDRYASDMGMYQLTLEQTAKGLAWLLGQWKTPNGAERKNNPFGFREQDALKEFHAFELVELYNAGNNHYDFFVPLYSVVSMGQDKSTYTGFQYYVAGGKINIIG